MKAIWAIWCLCYYYKQPIHTVFTDFGIFMQVADVSTSKTGKHGHAKCHFVAIDIFTGKKYEDLTPSSHNCDVSGHFRPCCRLQRVCWPEQALTRCCVAQIPHVVRQEYTLLDINDDGFVSAFFCFCA